MKRILLALSLALLLFSVADPLWRLTAIMHTDFVVHGQTINNVIQTVAGTGDAASCCDGSPAIQAMISPISVALDSAGNLYIADADNHGLRKVDSSNGIISTLTFGSVFSPSDVKVDSSDNVYVADIGSGLVLKGNTKGGLGTLAGTGFLGFSGDGGPADAAKLNVPTSVAVDSAGNVYILDSGNFRIRKIAKDTGKIQTVAGTGVFGFSGDGGPAASAQIAPGYPPAGMAVDSFGNLYFSDSQNGRVRRVSHSGIITTVAGGGLGTADDGVPALSASLIQPTGIAIDAVGTLFVADTGGSRIRRINGAGIMSTVVGTGASGYTGDGGPALLAGVYPVGIALDAAHNLYIADYGNSRVRTVALGIDISSMQARLNDHYIFPQVADGRLGDGSYYRSTVMVSNPDSSVTATCDLKVYGVSLKGSVYEIPPGSWIVAPSNGTGAFQAGYATLGCSSKVDASLIYSLYGADNTKVSEATVFPSPPVQTNRIFLDSHEGARLGIAIANDTDRTVNYKITGVDDLYRPLAATASIPPRSSRAAFLDQMVAISPDVTAQITITGDGPLSVIGLRFTGKTFTTIPSATTGPIANKYHVFPQYAVGALPDGTSYQTTLLVGAGNNGADCRYQRHPSIGAATTFSISLSSGDWFTYKPPASQPIESGYSTLLCSDMVDAQLLYALYAPDGSKLSEATVFSSPSAEVAQILADGREGARLALAIANDTDRSAAYLIRAGDSNGKEIGRVIVVIKARTTRAVFLDQLITVPPNNVGPVLINSDTAPINVIGIRFSGNLFSTIPSTNEPLVFGVVKSGTVH